MLFLFQAFVNSDVLWVVQEYNMQQNSHLNFPITEQVPNFFENKIIIERIGDSTFESFIQNIMNKENVEACKILRKNFLTSLD